MEIEVYLAGEKDLVENIAHILEKPYKTTETKENDITIYEIEIQIENKYKHNLLQIIDKALKIYNEF